MIREISGLLDEPGKPEIFFGKRCLFLFMHLRLSMAAL